VAWLSLAASLLAAPAAAESPDLATCLLEKRALDVLAAKRNLDRAAYELWAAETIARQEAQLKQALADVEAARQQLAESQRRLTP
jgi:hypothetical protein